MSNSKAYDAGAQDGEDFIYDLMSQNYDREEVGEPPITIRYPKGGWDEVCINAIGYGKFANLCGISQADAQKKTDAFYKACEEYNLGAYEACKAIISE